MQVSSRSSFINGFIGGAVLLTVSFVFRVVLNGPFLPEIAAGKIFATVPGQVESQAVLLLGAFAKYLMVLGLAVATAALYGLYNTLLIRRRIHSLSTGNVVNGLVFSLPLWLIHVGAAYVLDGVYFKTSLAESLILLLIAHLTYGATVGATYTKLPVEARGKKEEEEQVVMEQQERKGRGRARRIFIRRVAPAAIGLAILIYGIDRFLLPILTERQATEASLQELYAKEVTPTSEFYRTDIDLIPPSVDSSTWKLTVNGEVKKPVTFTYEEFRSLPQIKEYATLECISNPVGGPLIGTALWEGVHLSTVLEKVEVKPSAKYVVFYSVDGYSVAIPLERALKEGTILAYMMNGEPLNNVHGFPLRAVVPGIYGMMNAKWIQRIELVANEYLGYWQSRGWSNTAEIETTSVIRVLPPNVTLNETTPIAGIAFAGDRGVSRVEVSVDDGKTWSDAMRKDPLSKYTWILWAKEWIPSEEGLHTVTVRATDGNGQIQTAQLRGTFPDGATGYHAVDVLVKSTAEK
ncbi:MAG: molybdopterin-dependent oxidoreductase [Thaumarchaeota archaeon]|nr:molybdopterin-dependent oxidoreductase [Nitrososphaerota archaeon]MCL5317721.1 molybdopterin-dependent oxidoreductase [Nitrososphaerota archaeon]